MMESMVNLVNQGSNALLEEISSLEKIYLNVVTDYYATESMVSLVKLG